MLDAMKSDLRKLPLDERIRLVEDLWDSIAADQNTLPLTPEQRAELDLLDLHIDAGRLQPALNDVKNP